MSDKYSEKKRDKIWHKAFHWYGLFVNSEQFKALSELEQEEAELIVIHFADLMYVRHGTTPKRWNIADMEACCTEGFPFEIAAEPDFFELIAPVLSAFFRFLEEEEILLSAGLLARRVEQLGERIVDNAANPAMWGPAKTILATAVRAGLDMNSREEINFFMEHCNREIVEGGSSSWEISDPGWPLVIGRKRSTRKKTR
ncbi:MAG: hypothetical protein H7836_09930 [Magnetococcus sp. YQC-3]